MSLDIQMMIRNQANETRDALSKVVSWETEIEKRDEELIALAKQGKHHYDNPTTNRGGQKATMKPQGPKKVEIDTKPEEKPKSQNETSEKEVKKSAGSNPGRGAAPRTYEQWSSLDAKLKKLEAEDDEDETDKKEKSQETAESHKEKGNIHYKAKNYDLALRDYSTAIKLDSSNAVYYHNRSACFYALADYKESEKDATEAIRLDPRYVKAYMRRALAREALGKDRLAIEDLEAAQAITPDIKQINDKLIEIRIRNGISPDGKITKLAEPKVKITEEAEPVEKPKPKISIVEEEEKPKPKIAVVEEEEKPRTKPKITVVEEEKLEPMPTVPQRSARSVVIEEVESKSVEQPMPDKMPRKVSIVSEDAEEQKPQPRKIHIVTEDEEEAITKPKKVAIIEETAEEEKPAPKKIPIVVEEEKPAPKKIPIVVEEENPAPKKEEAKEKPKPKPKEEEKQEKKKNRFYVVDDDEQKPVRAAPKDAKPAAAPKDDGPELPKEMRAQINSPFIEEIKPILYLEGGRHYTDEELFHFVRRLGKHRSMKMYIKYHDEGVLSWEPRINEIIGAYSKTEGADEKLVEECKAEWKF